MLSAFQLWNADKILLNSPKCALLILRVGAVSLIRKSGFRGSSKYFYRHCKSTNKGVRVSAVSSVVFLFPSETSPIVSRRCCTKAPAYFIGQRELKW